MIVSVSGQDMFRNRYAWIMQFEELDSGLNSDDEEQVLVFWQEWYSDCDKIVKSDCWCETAMYCAGMV